MGSCENFQRENGTDEVSSVDYFDLGNAESSSSLDEVVGEEVVLEYSGIARVLEDGRNGYNKRILVCTLSKPYGGPSNL